jgi:hypothetical protein
MKALKINAPVNLNTGATLASGSLVVITEGLAQVFTTKEGSMNAQIVNAVYTSVEAFESGKAAVSGITDFNPAMYSLSLSVEDYSTKTAEALLVDTVEAQLEAVYPGSVEEVDVTPYVAPAESAE